MLSKDEIWEVLYKKVVDEYDLPFATPESDWFTDLGLNYEEHQKFFKWAEGYFGIAMPGPHFKTLGSLCKKIQFTMEQQKKHSFFRSIKERIQRIY